MNFKKIALNIIEVINNLKADNIKATTMLIEDKVEIEVKKEIFMMYYLLLSINNILTKTSFLDNQEGLKLCREKPLEFYVILHKTNNYTIWGVLYMIPKTRIKSSRIQMKLLHYLKEN